jgi:hypothetical protein
MSSSSALFRCVFIVTPHKGENKRSNYPQHPVDNLCIGCGRNVDKEGEVSLSIVDEGDKVIHNFSCLSLFAGKFSDR